MNCLAKYTRFADLIKLMPRLWIGHTLTYNENVNEVSVLGSARQRRMFQHGLIAWYGRAKRDVAWRRTKDPYAIWISEVMLQQTRVGVVEPYFNQWMRRFPTVQSLARATQQQALQAWSGLGYYIRARNLWRAARLIVKHFGGKVPREETALLKLPGIGRYTAGAIRSIAFGIPAPVVDGNVSRVLRRVFGLSDHSASVGQIWEIARQLVPDKEPGTYNQALMELGSTVCRPRAPQCNNCCVQAFCKGNKTGNPERFDVRKSVPSENLKEFACVVKSGRRFLLHRRGSNELCAGFWEFPRIRMQKGESPKRAFRRFVGEFTAESAEIEEKKKKIHSAFSGYSAVNLFLLAPLTYHVVRRRVHLVPMLGIIQAGENALEDRSTWRWLTLWQIQRLPASSPQRRIVEQLMRRQFAPRNDTACDGSGVN